MKSKMLYFFCVVMTATIVSCSDDDKPKLKGDADIVHEGEKWTIVSIDNYVLMDVSGTSVANKTGSVSNAGSFYFVENELKGSFEFVVDGYNKEDYFNFTEDTDGSINIVSVEQSVGANVNQNILAISGQRISETEITLDAVSIMKESTATGIFTFTATQITLAKVE